jgi:glutathione S-transferase
MTRKRLFIHSVFLVLLPIIVAWLGLGLAGATALVLLALVWRWLIVLSGIVAPEKTPLLELETTPASHYVEKVRWCMDRLGVEYEEKACGGTLGVFFTGRTVPLLKVRTGLVRTKIGNSPEILRYLWGSHYATHAEQAGFLQPTAERLEFERKLERYGRNLQAWIYYYLSRDRDLTLHLWGANSSLVPAWQRQALRIVFPLLAALVRYSFAVNKEHYEKSVLHIEGLLSYIDTQLADGRQSILGGDMINYTDLAFAALSGLWMQSQGYGGGKADGCRIDREQLPAEMRADIERWIEDHPKATMYVTRLYAEER